MDATQRVPGVICTFFGGVVYMPFFGSGYVLACKTNFWNNSMSAVDCYCVCRDPDHPESSLRRAAAALYRGAAGADHRAGTVLRAYLGVGDVQRHRRV